MQQIFVADQLFDGTDLSDRAIVTDGGVVSAVVARGEIPAGAAVTRLAGGVLAPGFVDLQVNGGGGVNFNAEPTVETLRRMAAAHAGLGALQILPTLVTDTPAVLRAALDAVRRAVAGGMPGILGLHLEGPHLSLARKGAHDPALIRPMTDADVWFLIEAARALPVLMMTLAPENVTMAQITALARAGVVLSIGHTDADFDTCMAAQAAGARHATHLFNAMSQLSSRAPGLVGAVLANGGLHAGLIADAVHVHPAAMAAALRAKAGPGQIYLVSDCMAPAGSDITEFTLNGRTVLRRDGRLTLADGTLAGADLDLPRALRVITGAVGLALSPALAMATSIPGDFIGGGHGRLQVGGPADFVHLDGGLHLRGVWRGAKPVDLSPATVG